MSKSLPKINPIHLIPNKSNLFIWLNAIFLIVLLIIGKADPLTIVMAYFLETLIIGIVNVFKMYKVISTNPSGEKNYFLIIFFLVHYTFFVAIQLIFVFGFLEMNDPNIKSGFNLFDNLDYTMSLKGMTLVLTSILIYNLADYYFNFIIPKTYKKTTTTKLFAMPYPRIIIQQFAVILGGFFMIFSSGLFAVAILLILFRTLIELLFLSNPQLLTSKLAGDIKINGLN
jgi:hypothetical protein